MDGLSVSGLADLAGATAAEVERLGELGCLAARDSTGLFLESDVPKVRLATACERAGLPMEGIVSAIRGGRLGFSFLGGAEGGDVVGAPGGPAFVFVRGGGAVSALGGAVGADLPAGEPGHWDPSG